MKNKSLLAAAAFGALAAMPASASTVVTGSCVSVTDSAGCLFNGNINGNTNPANGNSYLSAQNAYNAIRTPNIALTFIASSDDSDFGNFGSITGAGTANGTWTLAGYSIEYLAVKASNKFVLYKVSGSTGSWDTYDIPYRNNPHNLSHLTFFGAADGGVPEPSAWALMILGFGFAGVAMRRRKAAVTFA